MPLSAGRVGGGGLRSYNRVERSPFQVHPNPVSGLVLRKCEKLILATLRNVLLSSRKKMFAYLKAVIPVSNLRTLLDYLLWLLHKTVYLG